MSIELASVKEHYAGAPPWQDKNTEVQRYQRQLWQQLGTLHRTRANLRTVLGQCHSSELKDRIDDAIWVIERLINVNLLTQRNLPNKKRQRDSHKEDKTTQQL